jgi:hypothetical protein
MEYVEHSIGEYIELRKVEANNNFTHWSDGLELYLHKVFYDIKLNTQQVMYIYNEIKKYDTNKGE